MNPFSVYVWIVGYFSTLMDTHHWMDYARSATAFSGSEKKRNSLHLKGPKVGSQNPDGKQGERHTTHGSSECHTSILKSTRKDFPSWRQTTPTGQGISKAEHGKNPLLCLGIMNPIWER